MEAQWRNGQQQMQEEDETRFLDHQQLCRIEARAQAKSLKEGIKASGSREDEELEAQIWRGPQALDNLFALNEDTARGSQVFHAASAPPVSATTA